MSAYIKRDWAALAREGATLEVPPQPGFVYIGPGMPGLSDLFDIAQGFERDEDSSWYGATRLTGMNHNWDYVTTIASWERYTKLDYAQTITSPAAGSGKIATEYCNGIYNTLKAKFEDKLDTRNDLNFRQIKYLQLDGKLLSTEETLKEGVEVVSLSAFISRLEALQNKPKSVSARVNGVNVTVDGVGMAIGCQFVSHEEFQKIKAAVDRKREVEIVNTEKGMAVEISGSLISGGDLDFSFSEFDQIHELVKQVGKLS